MLAQALILREVSSLLLGQELSLALALAAWTLWSGLGARLKLQVAPLYALAAFCAVCGLSLLAARAAAMLLPVGSLPGLFALIVFSALLSAPAGLFAGVFSACALRERPRAFYILEALGAALAGAVHAFFLAGRVDSGPLLYGAAAAVLCAGAFCLRKELSRGSAAAVLAALGLLFAALSLDGASRAWRYQGLVLEREVETPYMRAAFARARGSVPTGQESRVYLEDGFITADIPDPSGREELAHLPLLAHPKPERVLMIGARGIFALREILAHKPALVELAEPDAQKARLALAGSSEFSRHSGSRQGALPTSEVSDEGPSLREEDPRRLLRASKGRYDVILQTVPEPVNAAANRFFTDGFFKEAQAALRPKGLLALSLPFSENYLAPESAYLDASIVLTARSAFKFVELVPGRRLTVLASDSPIELSPQVLDGRAARRKIALRALSAGNLAVLLHPERRAWLARGLEDLRTGGKLNLDSFPAAYFYLWRVWLSKFVEPVHLLGAAASVMLLLWALGKIWTRRREWSQRPAFYRIFALGFWGMSAQIALALLAQSALGSLHRILAAVFAAFMLGLAAGAAFGARGRNSVFWSRALLLAAAAVSLLLSREVPALLRLGGLSGLAIFLALESAAGFLTGAAFPVALDSGQALPTELYSADLFGASLGGFLCGALLVPGFGFAWTFLFAAVPCAVALAFSFVLRKISLRHPGGSRGPATPGSRLPPG